MEFKPSYSDQLYSDIQPSYTDSLMHHGIKGMHWGVRRYQNPDGSLTKAGLKRKKKLNKKADQGEELLKRGKTTRKEQLKGSAKYGAGLATTIATGNPIPMIVGGGAAIPNVSRGEKMMLAKERKEYPKRFKKRYISSGASNLRRNMKTLYNL